MWTLCKVKVKFVVEQAKKTPKGEYRYNSTLSLNLSAGWGFVVNATPWPLYPEENTEHGAHNIGG